MFLSKATAYGVRALTYLAGRADSGLCGLLEIAEHERIPRIYLRKLLGELRRHRLLRSVKGIHGGYELARAPQTITLWDIYRVLEPDPYLDNCQLGCGICRSPGSCLLHEEWQKLRTDLVAMLQQKTIAELAAANAEADPGVGPAVAGGCEC